MEGNWRWYRSWYKIEGLDTPTCMIFPFLYYYPFRPFSSKFLWFFVECPAPSMKYYQDLFLANLIFFSLILFKLHRKFSCGFSANFNKRGTLKKTCFYKNKSRYMFHNQKWHSRKNNFINKIFFRIMQMTADKYIQQKIILNNHYRHCNMTALIILW